MGAGSIIAKKSGPKSSTIRQIGSYYIHTWAAVDLDVSVGVSTDKSVSLSLNLSKSEGNWQVYNYVTFEF